MYARPLQVQIKVYLKKRLQFNVVVYDMGFFRVALSTLSRRQCLFPSFKQFLETELTWSQAIILRKCIFKNQNLCFVSR